MSDHDSQLCYHQYTKEDIVFDPRNHFYLNGIKFVSLRVVREMKRARAESKDWYDIVLIDRTLGVSLIKIFILRLLLFGKRVLDRLGGWVRLKIANTRNLIDDQFAPYIRTVHYCGYYVFYSKGTSIVQRIHDAGVYEGETCNAIVRELSHFKDPVFLDVGANVGLISINVLANIPDVVIHAFEPGIHQYELFKKTIEKNALQSKISLHSEALGDIPGQKSFFVHNSRDASGDGFIDTGRAGEAKTITVKVTTLDEWATHSEVSPNVIKIDTEGAELWVLQGGENYILKEKPVIFLEISVKNLHAYPYTHKEIVRWLHDHSYQLYTIKGVPVDEVTIVNYMDVEDTFIARTE